MTALPRHMAQLATTMAGLGPLGAAVHPDRLVRPALARLRDQLAFDRAASTEPKVSIAITGPIGEKDKAGRGVFGRLTAARIRLARGRPINLIIDSPGGFLDEAEAIVEALAAHDRTVAARVTGRCASAATLILLAASHREATYGSRFLVHKSETAARSGDGPRGRWTADALRRRAASLDAADDTILATYRRACPFTFDQIRSRMAGENRFSAGTAMRLGLVHRLVPEGAPW